ncbi:sporulation protein YqfD [Oscillibacter sp.]|uniref:sporulation protein YqfD n=1 Tax=Oscillibacter sp. TaxID=1945593 RepID=UPI0026087679|nr:sporulation protein YqfD [Oscillibacter sp.]MDD3347793.1 sporulation protein YqfD [Oscillibacter sp.]
MLNEVVNRLRGQVLVRVESVFPERVLNLCGARDLAFWDLRWDSPTAFTCRLSRRDFHALRRAAKNLDCTLTVAGREGAPYFLFRFRRRQALVVGLTACLLGLFFGSFFVWDFTVEGNETVPTEEILRGLEKAGVHLGSFGLSLDGEDIRNHVLLDIPELSWLTVNVSGCRANVQVRERIPAPKLVDERTPANVVARRAGMVLKVQALDGVAAVMKGATVTEGQLLISGVEDTDTFGARVMAGMGHVTARTWYTLTASMPVTVAEKQSTDREKTGFSLIIGTHRIKFFSNSSIEGAKYDKITTRYPCRLLGLSLPLTLERETWRFYETAAAERSDERGKATAEAALTAYLHSLVDPYGTVRSTLCTTRRKGDTLLVTLTAECEEQIGESVPILTQDADG